MMDHRSKFFKTKVEHVFQGQDSELMLLLKEIVLNITHLRVPQSTESEKEKEENDKKERFNFLSKQKNKKKL